MEAGRANPGEETPAGPGEALAESELTRRTFLKTALVAGAAFVLAACESRLPTPLLPTKPMPSGSPIFSDPSRSFEDRVDDLVARMTVEEKISQMGSGSPPIKRLGIPAYNWWSEAGHGVARAGIATVFPQTIGMAATWNPRLISQMGAVVSDEGRAKHHDAVRQGGSDLYTGLTFFCPNINIFRDPRWGRGQETYGEDPYLTSQISVSYIRGLQGDDPRYLKTVATAKHYAVHSGPDAQRHSFDAVVSQRDLRMTYLPAFRACVVEAGVDSVMGAYNRVNGEACCASPTLLGEILRDEWQFDGYVVADCGAVDDIFSGHGLARSREEASAMAVKAGCDLECGCTYGIACDYGRLEAALAQGMLTEDDIDRSVKRLLMARFRLGMFDPDNLVAYSQIPMTVVDSPAHQELALEVARQSLVLLKNDGLLPLDRSKVGSIAVVGPTADDTMVLTGNYMGTPSEPVSVLAGIKALAAAGARVNYARGCDILDPSRDGFAEAVDAAKASDVVVAVVGLSQLVEGEAGQQEGNPPGVYSLGDRDSLDLPGVQEDLLKALKAAGKPMVVVLLNGSAVAVNWAASSVPAILEAWYPGQAGGTAVAEALFGLTNPGGRLPVTFYRSVSDLPAFDDYSMANRTYRYFTGQPLYGFGFGLSYTTFAYRDLHVSPTSVKAGESVTGWVEVENTGRLAGDEVVQVYLADVQASLPVPRVQLVYFSRVGLKPGEKRKVQFKITGDQMSFADEAGEWVLEPGDFKVWVGGRQPNLGGGGQPANVLEGQFRIRA
jgi:beta-glucosidase